MKRIGSAGSIVGVLAVIISFFALYWSTAGAADANKVFQVKSGIVEMSTDIMKGQTITMYFDEYGAR